MDEALIGVVKYKYEDVCSMEIPWTPKAVISCWLIAKYLDLVASMPILMSFDFLIINSSFFCIESLDEATMAVSSIRISIWVSLSQSSGPSALASSYGRFYEHGEESAAGCRTLTHANACAEISTPYLTL